MAHRPPPGGQTACLVGLLSAPVRAYWGMGGTKLLDTLEGSLERQGRAGNTVS
jgi:hypothetical protein